MKHYLKYLLCFVLSVGLLISPVLQVVSYADVNDLLIATDSDALSYDSGMLATGSNADPYGLMTLELDDYGVAPASSVGSVSNTVDWDLNRTVFRVHLYNPTTKVYINEFKYPTEGSLEDGVRFVYSAPDGYEVYRLYVYNVLLGNYSNAPRPGTYDWDIDVSSAFSHTYSSYSVVSSYVSDNTALLDEIVAIPSSNIVSSSGDLCVSDLNISVASGLERFGFRVGFGGTRPNQLDLVVKESFVFSAVTDENISTVNPGVSSEQSMEGYQSEVNSSLSDLSSSMDDLSSSMEDQAENTGIIADVIQNLASDIVTGMEPHYDNVLTQLHHITEQLHSFWDQLYNMFYLPQYARLGEILDAIQSADSGAVSNLGVLKQTVEKISNDIQANDKKLSADQIAADDANTEEVKESIEEHGNFIIEGLKGLFIPSDEFFKSYFDDLYAWFSDRFGFLSFPIDLLSRIVDLFVNSSSTDCILTLPSFEISGEQLLQEHSFNLTDFLEENFAFLLSSIRMVSSIGLIMAFVNLCGDKWNEVMRN